MHLSRLTLDPHNAQARRDLADPYEMHRTLVRAFAKQESDIPPRFLWRLEPMKTFSDAVVLVQSADAPDWAPLAALPCYLKQRQVQTKIIQLDDLLQTGKCYRFRLFANPTVTREGKRFGLVTEDAQLAWLARQGERLGFTVEACLVVNSDVVKSKKGTMPITLRRACFEGVLRAEAASGLIRAVRDGIGPGKALGCGLLSVAPCR